MRIERNASVPLHSTRNGRSELYELVEKAIDEAAVNEWIGIHDVESKSMNALTVRLRTVISPHLLQTTGLCLKVKQLKQENGEYAVFVSKQRAE